MTYRERREAKAERLRDWAAKREQKAAASFQAVRTIADSIPLGQPILVGHHSERHARRDQDRIHSGMRRGIEHQRTAESMTSRADNIEAAAAGAIYSDDPDAIEALEAKIATLEAQRESFKVSNALYRKEHRAELAEIKRTQGAYHADCAMPHQAYEGSNLSGNISRLRKRLEFLRTRKERTAQAEASGGVLIEDFGGHSRITFTEYPGRDIVEALRAAGFTYSGGTNFGPTDRIPECVRTFGQQEQTE